MERSPVFMVIQMDILHFFFFQIQIEFESTVRSFVRSFVLFRSFGDSQSVNCINQSKWLVQLHGCRMVLYSRRSSSLLFSSCNGRPILFLISSFTFACSFGWCEVNESLATKTFRLICLRHCISIWISIRSNRSIRRNINDSKWTRRKRREEKRWKTLLLFLRLMIFVNRWKNGFLLIRTQMSTRSSANWRMEVTFVHPVNRSEVINWKERKARRSIRSIVSMEILTINRNSSNGIRVWKPFSSFTSMWHRPSIKTIRTGSSSFCFEQFRNEHQETCFAPVGFITIYLYYAYPEKRKKRARIRSQHSAIHTEWEREDLLFFFFF